MKHVILKGIAYSFACVMLLSCSDDEGTDAGLTNLNLVFEDNFDRDPNLAPNDVQSIDTQSWNYDLGTGSNGWGNNELQYYTDRPENISINTEGHLVITARRESFGNRDFTSARINTKDKIEQKYGRFEARIQVPGGRGVWPAFWMLGSVIETEEDDDPNTIVWPFAGEIDILELRGQEPSKSIGSLHGPGFSGGNSLTGDFDLEGDRFDADFHVFAVEWTPDYVDYFIDDVRFNRISKEDVPDGGDWVFDDHSFFMLLNVAVGGSFVGFPVDSTPLPQQMIVDYVRIYEIEN